MTALQKLNELFEIYQKVSLLSDKNNCKTLRVRHKTLQKDLVIHILPEHNSVYQTLCAIKQDNLPIVYDVFDVSDGMIVLEEFINGLTVAQVMETGRYTYHGAKKVIKEVCCALDVLHSSSMVHRDIKPENVMIDKNGRVVLIDFNASRVVKQASKDTVVMGTMGYASPEQLGVAQSDARTDIYALGVLFNVMLTGKHPSEIIAKGRAGRIIKNCTAINPDDRYQSAKKLSKYL